MSERSVLVVGGGGREAALVDAYSKSPQVDALFSVPGNDLMQDLTDKPVKTFPSLKTTDTAAIVDICRQNDISLVDIAQDNAVEAGLADTLLREGVLHIGPTRAAGQLEWDKGWSREFMKTQSIPHPTFAICRNPQEGYAYLESQPDQPWVVKANGLAEGKGVLLVDSRQEAMRAIEEMQRFGLAGATFLLEQMLVGEEFSTSRVEGVSIYGAGTKRVDGRNYANGGRLFYVVGEGNSVIEAREKAYEAISVVSVDGNNLHFRTDIGWRDVQRFRNSGRIFTGV